MLTIEQLASEIRTCFTLGSMRSKGSKKLHYLLQQALAEARVEQHTKTVEAAVIMVRNRGYTESGTYNMACIDAAAHLRHLPLAAARSDIVKG